MSIILDDNTLAASRKNKKYFWDQYMTDELLDKVQFVAYGTEGLMNVAKDPSEKEIYNTVQSAVMYANRLGYKFSGKDYTHNGTRGLAFRFEKRIAVLTHKPLIANEVNPSNLFRMTKVED